MPVTVVVVLLPSQRTTSDLFTAGPCDHKGTLFGDGAGVGGCQGRDGGHCPLTADHQARGGGVDDDQVGAHAADAVEMRFSAPFPPTPSG